jgi:hypothetical protein
MSNDRVGLVDEEDVGVFIIGNGDWCDWVCFAKADD